LEHTKGVWTLECTWCISVHVPSGALLTLHDEPPEIAAVEPAADLVPPVTRPAAGPTALHPECRGHAGAGSRAARSASRPELAPRLGPHPFRDRFQDQRRAGGVEEVAHSAPCGSAAFATDERR
jgi:hypothetical protein